jgi:hypothetical protein
MTEDSQPPSPSVNKGASLVFILVFALAAFFALRAPDYSGMPVPGLTPAPHPAITPAVLLRPRPVLPANLPGQAAEALTMARQWRPDAALVQIEVQQAAAYVPVFSFISPGDKARLDITGKDPLHKTPMTSAPAPLNPAAPATPIILRFIDLPTAVNFAKMEGMSGDLGSATLRAPTTSSDQETPVWSLQPATDTPAYKINGVTGLPSGRGAP